MTKVSADLGEVQETLLIPLYGRARDARARHPVLGDRKAVELVGRIDYDFSAFSGPSLAGSVLRTAIFDGWVRRFLQNHPDGTVVELGSGLNTRSDRLDNGRAHWFDLDLDLPDSIALRRRFFDDTARRRTIGGSVLDTDWMDEVAAAPGPYFLVSEAVLLYLAEDEVRSVVARLGERFAGSSLSFDTGGRTMMDSQDRNPVFRAVEARMTWVCDDPAALEDRGLRLVESRTFATPQPDVGREWPRRFRLGMPLLARVAPSPVEAYRMNLFTPA